MAGLDTSYLVVPFPEGNNASDTIIAGVHFNRSTLEHWNYTLYTNDTLSNGSKCILTFEPYTADYVFPNGSFTNSTTCYHPYYSIGTRAAVGLAFAAGFAICLIMTIAILARLGRLHLPVQKRFIPVGRRWQWYLAIITCATAMVSLMFNIDVDRYYLPDVPIILNSLFWFLMQMTAVAAVWEAARHWGSWMERQAVDQDSTILHQDDRRATVEFWLPLFFYLFWGLHVAMALPRSWSILTHQRYPGQAEVEAAAMATHKRSKVAGFLLLAGWCVIVLSLGHSAKHYQMRNPDPKLRSKALAKMIPSQFLLLLPITLGMVAYQILISFEFDYSPLKIETNIAAMYAGGYLPSLLVVAIMNLYGFWTRNDDLELIRQRRERGVALDGEGGRTRNFSWRTPVKHGNPSGVDIEDRLARNIQEIQVSNTNRPTSSLGEDAISMTPATQHQRVPETENPSDNPPPPYEQVPRSISHNRYQAGGTGTETGPTGVGTAPPRPFRSMLDV